jgi:hypothetical protein
MRELLNQSTLQMDYIYTIGKMEYFECLLMLVLKSGAVNLSSVDL